MSTQVTVNLPDDIYHRARQLARGSGRSVSDFLAYLIASSLGEGDLTLADQPDADVLALAQIQMDAAQSRRLSQLLDEQDAGQLSADQEAELDGLLAIYEELLLRKSEALREAVERGLRPPTSVP